MRGVLTWGGAAAVAAAMTLLAGCEGSRNADQVTGGSRDIEKDAEQLEGRLARSRDLTYTATYERRAGDGTTEELVIAQDPPRSTYRQGDTLLIDDGQTVVSCSGGGGKEGKQECGVVGSSTDAGVYGAAAGTGFAFNPAAVIGLHTTAAAVPGVEAGRSSRDIAGQRSECVSIRFTQDRERGKSFESCTTEDGIFSFSDDGEGNVVTLTRYEREAGDELFTPPAVPG